MKQIRGIPLATDCDSNDIRGRAVVIDVLRASTTICSALANGATTIQPFPEIELARSFAVQHPGAVLTGGEREGVKVDGFDLGNSPLEYTKDRVTGKTVAFTTTNGTRAMEKCRNAEEVLIGSFCNLAVLVDFLSSSEIIELVCAGTSGELSVEDCAFAGAMVEGLGQLDEYSLDSGAELCLNHWLDAKQDLQAYLRSGLGGQNLIRLGRDKDIQAAAELNSVPVVPRLLIEPWRIDLI